MRDASSQLVTSFGAGMDLVDGTLWAAEAWGETEVRRVHAQSMDKYSIEGRNARGEMRGM